MDDYGSAPESSHPQPITVPVVADSVSRTGSAPYLARCVYFVITTDEPNLPCLLNLPNATIPFLLVGLQGIIYRPTLPNTDIFVFPNQWDELVKNVEQLDGFSVDFEYLWVPVDLLDRARATLPAGMKSSNNQSERGDVFRLSQLLFMEAWRAAKQGTDFKGYAVRVLDKFDGDRLTTGLAYSPEESKSLEIWSISQVAMAQIG